MKSHFKLLSGIVLVLGVLSACSTGSVVSSGKYADDVYFTPGDTPPPVVSKSTPAQGAVNSAKSQERAARVVDEYFDDTKGEKSPTYSLNNEDSSLADTTSGYDLEADAEDIDEYEDLEDIDEMSYSTRIRTYYDPYMYDPFWDYGWSMGWGFGHGGWYGGYYGGWYSPWHYGGWYDPWYSYGWGSYGWGYPYYYDYPYYGYYGGGGLWGGGGYWDGGSQRDRYYGRQNRAGRIGGGSNAVNYGDRSATLRSGSMARTYSPANGNVSGRRGAATQGSNTRQAGTRYTVDPGLSTRSARMQSTQQGTTRSTETLMNLRRSQQGTGNTLRQGTAPSGSSGVRQGTTSGQSVTRQSSTTQQRYVPTYTRPRPNTQATYNSGTREYTRPESTSRSSENRYSKPGSYSSPNRSSSSYSSGSTYQRRSESYSPGSTRSSENTYSAPSRSYSSGDGGYSAPSRSSGSSGTYSAPSGGGGSYGGGGGSYGGGSSGGGGGSSSGRRR